MCLNRSDTKMFGPWFSKSKQFDQLEGVSRVGEIHVLLQGGENSQLNKLLALSLLNFLLQSTSTKENRN